MLKLQKATLYLCILLCGLTSIGYASATNQQVTVLFPSSAGVISFSDLCAYGIKQGLNMVCLPLPGSLTGNEAMIVEKADRGPVVFMSATMAWTQNQVRNRMIDLKPLIARETRYKQVLERIWAEPGGLYGRADTRAVFFNVPTLRNLGIEVPPALYHWDELVSLFGQTAALLPQSAQRNLKNFGIGLSSTDFLAYYLVAEDEKITRNEPQSVYNPVFGRALEALRQLNNVGYKVNQNSANDFGRSFSDGSRPITIGYLSEASRFPASINWQVLPLPGEAQGAMPLQLSDMWGLAGKGDIQSAWEILMWITVGDGAAYMQQHYPLSLTPVALAGKSPALPQILIDRGASTILDAAVKGWAAGNSAASFNTLTSTIRVLQPRIDEFATNDIPLDDMLGELEGQLQAKSSGTNTSVNTSKSNPELYTLGYTATQPGSQNKPVVRLLTFGDIAFTKAIQTVLTGQLPNLRIEVLHDSTPTNLIAKTLPATLDAGEYDLVLLTEKDMAQAAIVQGLVLPIDNYLAAEKGRPRAWLDVVNRLRVNNRVYDIPLTISPHLVAYNVDTFTARGVPLPQPGWTWDVFRQKAVALTNHNTEPAVYGAAGGLISSIWTLMVRQAEKGGFTASFKTYQDNLQMLTEMAQDHRSLLTISRNSLPLRTGEVAMYFTNSALFRQDLNASMSTQNIRPHLGVALPPGANPVLQGTEGQLTSIAITRRSPKAALAWQVATFLSGATVAKSFAMQGLLPVYTNPEVLNIWGQRFSPEWPLSGAASLMNLAYLPSRGYSTYDKVREAMAQKSMEAMRGSISVAEAVSAVQAALQDAAVSSK